jgi:hypothetical protein
LPPQASASRTHPSVLTGEQQSFSDAEKAHWALVRLMAESSLANDRFFTLSEDGVQKECDRETWEKDSTNREKTRVKITCSSEIEASIFFLGHASSIIHMDEEVRLWTAGFCLIAKNEHLGARNSRASNRPKLLLTDLSRSGVRLLDRSIGCFF